MSWTDGLQGHLCHPLVFLFDSETDDLAYQTLQRVGQLQRYHQWMFSRFKHLWADGSEIGSGIGNMTRYLLDREFVVGNRA